MRSLPRSLWFILLAMPTTGLGSSIHIAYVTMFMESRGYSNGFIGLGHALHIGSIGLVAPVLPWVMQHIHPGKLLALSGSILLLTLTALAFWMPMMQGNSMLFLALRLVFGIALGCTYVIGESWLNSLCPAEKRGRIMGIYGSLLATAFASGPMIVSFLPGGVAHLFAFGLSGACYIFTAMMILSQWPTAPSPTPLPWRYLLKHMFHWPSVLVCLLSYGALESSLVSLLPLYLLQHGHSKAGALWLVSVACGGAICMQWIIGWLADKYPHRHLLAIACSLSAVGALGLYLLKHDWWWLQPVVFVWGGIFSALYTVPFVMLCERMIGINIAIAAASALMMYGAGSLLAPALIGKVMDASPEMGFPLMMGLCSLLALGVVVIRLHMVDRRYK